MRQQVEAVRQADHAEAIHQMRVASRRMRAALAIFTDALPKAKARRWTKQVRGVTRALGAARDADVQIEFVEQMIQRTADRKHRPGLVRLKLRLTQQRDKLQAPVDKAMDRLESSGLFTAMPRDLHAITVAAQTETDHAASDELLRYGRNVIQHRLEELLAYQQFVDQPHMAEQLHEMRIAAKRLRYTFEIFAPCWSDRLDRPLRKVKRLQTQLGELHDMDMWIEKLPRFLEDERERHVEFHGRLTGFSRLRPGIEDLLEYCIGERLKAYEQFRGTWEKLFKQKFWPKLRKILKEGPAKPKAPPTKTPDTRTATQTAANSADAPSKPTRPKPVVNPIEPAPPRPRTGSITEN